MNNENRRCVIFAGGEPVKLESIDLERVNSSYVICADRGFKLANELSIHADMVLGDFDSLGYVPDSENLRQFPVEKDDTDLMLAIKEALDMGFTEFDIYGACGGRLDHMVGNIQCLKLLLDNGAWGQIISDNENIALYRAGEYRIKKRAGFSLSLFAYSPTVEGLTIKSTKYTAQNAKLSYNSTLGVSNEFDKDYAEISFTDGTLMVICSKLDK